MVMDALSHASAGDSLINYSERSIAMRYSGSTANTGRQSVTPSALTFRVSRHAQITNCRHLRPSFQATTHPYFQSPSHSILTHPHPPPCFHHLPHIPTLVPLTHWRDIHPRPQLITRPISRPPSPHSGHKSRRQRVNFQLLSYHIISSHLIWSHLIVFFPHLISSHLTKLLPCPWSTTSSSSLRKHPAMNLRPQIWPLMPNLTTNNPPA